MTELRDSQLAQLNRKLALRERELREWIRTEMVRPDADRAVGDAGDESVANATADLDAALVDRQMRELAEIESAKARMKARTYGICIDCGGEILWQRLVAYPVSERCVRCADRHEHAYAHEGTPSL